MRIATMTAPKKIQFSQGDIPECKAGQLRLKIQRIGICGSDIHVWHGQHPFTSYPIIQGHEFVGIIDGIGSDLDEKDFPLGQLATTMPQIVCKNCNPCLAGQYNICENLKVRGFQANGCGQDYFVTDAERVFILPCDFSLNQGVFMEPVAVAAHAVGRLGNIENENIIITGAGPIGNLIAQLAQRKGANVLLLDLEEERLKIAQKCGIKHVGNVGKQSLAQIAEKLFSRGGYKIAIEASGAEAALQSVIPSIEKGGTILLVGVYAQPVTVDMARASEHELTIKGSMMYWEKDWHNALQYLKDGLSIEAMVTNSFAFEQWMEAYAYIDKNRSTSLKVMITL